MKNTPTRSYYISELNLNVVASKFLISETIQFRKPKTKKKRIRNKFYKDKKNFKETHKALKFGNTIVVPECIFEDFLNKLQNGQKKDM